MKEELQLLNKPFSYALVFGGLAVILSYFGFVMPMFNAVAWWAVVGLTLVLSWKKLEYGLWILLMELILTSKGHLFGLVIRGQEIGVRQGIFVAVFLAWLIYLARARSFKIRRTIFWWPLVGVGLVVVYGLVLSLINKQSFSLIFNDVNGYLFFALAPVFFEVLIDRAAVKRVLRVLVAGLLLLGFKTVFLLYLFSHDSFFVAPTVYRWLRYTGVAEITMMTDLFARIFFQSHVWALLGFFVFLAWWSSGPVWPRFIARREDERWVINERLTVLVITLSSLFMLMIGLSRSFWVGLIGGVATLIALYIWRVRAGWRRVGRLAAGMLVITAMSVAIIMTVVNIPFPPRSSFFTGSIFGDRATALTTEAGVASRWQLLPPLWEKIKDRPIFGYGWGQTVTYQSQDPRVLAKDPEGWFTTYIFEWGYLDLWLKVGLFGVVLYAGFIFQLLCHLWRLTVSGDQAAQLLSWGLLAAVIALLATHAFSPYLNHPLGVGYLLFSAGTIDNFKKMS